MLYLVILIFIIQIKSDDPVEIVCHERCQICSANPTESSQECDTCKERVRVKYDNEIIYFAEGTKNCYADHEKPDYYISEGILKKCPNHCYQCQNENLCLSCERGYVKNGETCEKCPEDRYTFITDALEYCEGTHKNFYHCKLKYTICSYVDINYAIECPKEQPLLRADAKECVLENIAECPECVISSPIAKTQWLNKVTDFGPVGCWFIEYALSSKGDLILYTYNFDIQKTDRYYYGFRQNGRPFFYNSDTNNYEYEKTMQIPNFYWKFESEMIKINIYNGDDNKDYFLSVPFGDFSMDVSDLENGVIYNTNGNKITGNSFWTSLYFSIFELKNEHNVYMFCYIMNQDNDISQSYLSLNKIKFLKADINSDDSFERISYTEVKEELKVMYTRILSCLDIDKVKADFGILSSEFPVIQCFI